MTNLLNRIRSGADQVAFEADKLRRVTAMQSTVKGLKEEFMSGINQAGHAVYKEFQAGEVSNDELKSICERLEVLQAEIAAKEKEVEAIRQEEFEATRNQTVETGLWCPNGHGELKGKFCPDCGAPAIDSPPGAPAPVSFAEPAGATCPQCGKPVKADGKFCMNCGAALGDSPVSDAPVLSDSDFSDFVEPEE